MMPDNSPEPPSIGVASPHSRLTDWSARLSFCQYMKLTACIACFIFAVISGHGAEFDLGTHGTLSINVPDDWKINGKEANRPDGTPIGYAFAIKPRNDADAKCLLTIAYTTNGVPNSEAIQKAVLRECEEFVSESVEKRENLKQFSLETGFGAYCLFTDASLVGKTPSPGDYKVMGSGIVQPGKDMTGVVTLFANDGDSKEFKAMVSIINSLKVKSKDAK